MACQIKIQIEETERPLVWRRVAVSSRMSLTMLHKTIQVVFGWSDKMFYKFRHEGSRLRDDPTVIYVHYDEPKDIDPQNIVMNTDNVVVGDVFALKPVLYYAYGDRNAWSLTLIAENTDMRWKGNARCMAGGGMSPPEDCGGPVGFAALKEDIIQKANKKRKHPMPGTDRLYSLMFGKPLMSVGMTNRILRKIDSNFPENGEEFLIPQLTFPDSMWEDLPIK